MGADQRRWRKMTAFAHTIGIFLAEALAQAEREAA